MLSKLSLHWFELVCLQIGIASNLGPCADQYIAGYDDFNANSGWPATYPGCNTSMARDLFTYTDGGELPEDEDVCAELLFEAVHRHMLGCWIMGGRFWELVAFDRGPLLHLRAFVERAQLLQREVFAW